MTALLNIGIALLMAGLSIPLILRKVPMNTFYGVRFPQSYKSDKAWYEINAYGGKALLFASIPIFLVGLYGLLTHSETKLYFFLSTGVTLCSAMLACLASYLKARKVDRGGI